VGIAAANEHDLIPRSQYEAALRVLGINPITGRLPKARTQKPSRGVVENPENQEEHDEVAKPEEDVQPENIRKHRHKVAKKPRREIVGHLAEVMAYLTPHDVERIHWALVKEFDKSRDPINPPGVRSNDLLESAVFRVHTGLAGERKYPTIAMAAAAYLHAIIANHAFHNGNKRTALVSMLVFLDLNGYLLEVEEDALFDYLIRIASHNLDVPGNHSLSDGEMIQIAKWVSGHSRPLVKEERPLKFHQLREILNTYECSFEHPKKGNRVNIQRGANRVQVYYRNEGTDVALNTIRKIRKELELTEEDGYDSTIFYNAANRIPAFIRKYRRTLQRLAKA
jgi:death-on-curing family protein